MKSTFSKFSPTDVQINYQNQNLQLSSDTDTVHMPHDWKVLKMCFIHAEWLQLSVIWYCDEWEGGYWLLASHRHLQLLHLP